ncbi:MAG TPA: hypothetical protein VER55_15585, partial [Ardenticatenaceae bacterium]|nr:hypothetical protein [Ardenticatenaceae bacterium]
MIQEQLAKLVYEAISAAQQGSDLPDFDVPSPGAIPIERPKQPEHGDFATPVAMQLARPARRSPRQIAEALVRQLPLGD